MARIDTRRGGANPWTPAPPPAAGSSGEQIVRATWDELERLKEWLNTPDTPPAPVAPPKLQGTFAVGNDTIAVGPTFVYNALMDASVTAYYNEPAASPPYNPATGYFTVPSKGTYSIRAEIITNPVPTPTGVQWSTFLQCKVGAGVWSNINSGIDTLYMQNNLFLMLSCNAGDLISFYGAGQHPTRTGTVAIVCMMSIRREGD